MSSEICTAWPICIPKILSKGMTGMWFIHHPYVSAWQYRKLMPICPDEKVGTRYEVAYVREMNKGEHCEVFFLMMKI